MTQRITADLLPLKETLVMPDPLEYRSYTRDELQRLITSGQKRVIDSLRHDVFAVERMHNPPVSSSPNKKLTYAGVVSGDLTYKLTTSLAGRNLTEENVTPLADAIVGSLESALECRNDETPLGDCRELRRSSERFWTALQNLGLKAADLQIVTRSFLNCIRMAALPPEVFEYK